MSCGAVRHLAGPDAIAEDCGLQRPKFDEVSRLCAAMPQSLESDTASTLALIAREADVTPDQVRYVWQAWVRSDQHPAAGRT